MRWVICVALQVLGVTALAVVAWLAYQRQTRRDIDKSRCFNAGVRDGRYPCYPTCRERRPPPCLGNGVLRL